MKKYIGIFLLGLAVFLTTAYAEDDTAFDQLNNMHNTGVTFDGSDGKRSGMDIDVKPASGNIPEPPPPTPVEIPELPATPQPEIDPVKPEPMVVDPIKPEPMTVDVDTTTYTDNGTSNTEANAKDAPADDAQNDAGE